MPKTRVLFVCLGNICRSPLAEGVFRALLAERGLEDRFDVDSCGTGAYHAGERADARMRATADRRGVHLASIARGARPDDASFDHILVMDHSNRANLLPIIGDDATPRVRLLLDCWPDAPTREVPDPYYGGADGFERVFDLVDAACRHLLDELCNA